uniref:Putative ovule protein n=1 Tax=Solanum chacoense TaxID=4108 RepID=A0A0V0H4L8_SOLCH
MYWLGKCGKNGHTLLLYNVIHTSRLKKKDFHTVFVIILASIESEIFVVPLLEQYILNNLLERVLNI